MLSLPVAGFGHRSLAYLVDVALLSAFWTCAYFALTLLVSDTLGLFRSLRPWGLALFAMGLFASQWLYWTVSEVTLKGQTLGKRALGIRVVREDGSSVGVFESAVRNLLRAVDFLPGLYALGGLSVLLTERHQRLGDVLAGTVLIREQRHRLDRYELAASVPLESGGTPLTTEEAELVHEFLGRSKSLLPDAREHLLAAFVERFGGHLTAEERTRLSREHDRGEAFLRARAGGASL